LRVNSTGMKCSVRCRAIVDASHLHSAVALRRLQQLGQQRPRKRRTREHEPREEARHGVPKDARAA
jgi:hypothetical protein